MRRESIGREVVRRAMTRYAAAISLALAAGGATGAAAAADVYALADFRLAGLQLDGPLFEGSAITRCFRGRGELLLKPLDRREHECALALQEALRAARAAPIPCLTTFELHPHGAKIFMIMSLYGASLEHLATLDVDDVRELWRCASGALRGLHALGFAHMDVKPANICLASAEGFMLVDIGSTARFDEVTAATLPYVAADFPGAMRRSSARLDWWLLAMSSQRKHAASTACPSARAPSPL